MRGASKVLIGVAVLALAAGTIVATQLAFQAGPDRLSVGAPLSGTGETTADETTTDVATTAGPTTAEPTTDQPTTTTTATTTTPPRSRPPTTTKPKPKPTTTAKPKPRQATGAPCIATARACIDLSANRSWLLDGAGHVIYGPVPITSGRPGYRTPTGTFHVLFKDIDHLSAAFDNAPMPYSVFFVGGIAFHAGSLRVPSHGCIHLSTAAAQTYFKTLNVGDIVQVVP